MARVGLQDLRLGGHGEGVVRGRGARSSRVFNPAQCLSLAKPPVLAEQDMGAVDGVVCSGR